MITIIIIVIVANSIFKRQESQFSKFLVPLSRVITLFWSSL